MSGTNILISGVFFGGAPGLLIEEIIKPAFEVYASQEIVEEYRKGYKIGNKVIRHSMVIVAN